MVQQPLHGQGEMMTAVPFRRKLLNTVIVDRCFVMHSGRLALSLLRFGLHGFPMSVLMRNTPVRKDVTKQQILHISHRQDTHASDITSLYHSHICSKTLVFSLPTWSCPHKNSLPSKNGNRWHGQQEDRDHAWLPQSTTKRWSQKLRSVGETVSHNIGQPRGAEARVCLVFPAFLVSHGIQRWKRKRRSQDL